VRSFSGDIIFLSDVHLGGYDAKTNEQIERDLLTLLNYVEKNGQIILVGDLFDYWMEYRGKWPKYGESVLKAFESINKKSPTIYITGNHDNWTGERILDAGFDVEHEYREVEIDGKRVFLLHGDGLTDERFKFERPGLNRVIRNRQFLDIYQTIFPPKVGVEIMRKFSSFSKWRDTGVQNSTKRIDRFVKTLLKEPEIDVVVCGHYHVHRFINDEDGLYINLGTFYRHRTVGRHTKGMFELVTWDGNGNRFTTFEVINK
jgi:UDP-2,3-diacylglucosamine hydrolase